MLEKHIYIYRERERERERERDIDMHSYIYIYIHICTWKFKDWGDYRPMPARKAMILHE